MGEGSWEKFIWLWKRSDRFSFPSFYPSFLTDKDFLRFLYKLSKKIIKMYSSIALCLLNFLVGSTNYPEIKVWLSKSRLTVKQWVLEEKMIRSETSLLLWAWGYIGNDWHLHGFSLEGHEGLDLQLGQTRFSSSLLCFCSSHILIGRTEPASVRWLWNLSVQMAIEMVK